MVIDCTKEKPWDKISKPGVRVRHVDADEIGEQKDGWPGGDLQRYRCPNCNHEWEAELPQ